MVVLSDLYCVHGYQVGDKNFSGGEVRWHFENMYFKVSTYMEKSQTNQNSHSFCLNGLERLCVIYTNKIKM